MVLRSNIVLVVQLANIVATNFGPALLSHMIHCTNREFCCLQPDSRVEDSIVALLM